MSEPNERDRSFLVGLAHELHVGCHPASEERALRKIAAFREGIEQGLSDRIMQRDALKAKVAELEADIAQVRADYNLRAYKRAEAEVERLRSLDDETSCPASERAGYEGLIAAMTEEIGEWRAKADAAEKLRNDICREIHKPGGVFYEDMPAIVRELQAAAHALEVIEREALRVEYGQNATVIVWRNGTSGTPVAYFARKVTEGAGPTITEAVADYERRKAKGGE